MSPSATWNAPSSYIPKSQDHCSSEKTMIVMKFGGSSVESAAAIERVAKIVAGRRRERPLVIVSAMAKTTDRLVEIGESAAAGRRAKALRLLEALREFHDRETAALGEQEILRPIFEELTELVHGLAVLGELTPRARDAVMSYGERLSSLIVARYFAHFGLLAVHVDSQRCMITDDRHTQAQPLDAPTRARMKKLAAPQIAAGKIVVMGGLFGRDLRRGPWREAHRDLDRCRRRPHRRPARLRARQTCPANFLRGSGGTRILRRKSSSPRDDLAGDREKHSGASIELSSTRSQRHAYRASRGRRGTISRHRLQAEYHAGGYHLHAHVDGLRISGAHLPGFRCAPHLGGHDRDHRSQRQPDGRRHASSQADRGGIAAHRARGSERRQSDRVPGRRQCSAYARHLRPCLHRDSRCERDHDFARRQRTEFELRDRRNGSSSRRAASARGVFQIDFCCRRQYSRKPCSLGSVSRSFKRFAAALLAMMSSMWQTGNPSDSRRRDQASSKRAIPSGAKIRSKSKGPFFN